MSDRDLRKIRISKESPQCACHSVIVSRASILVLSVLVVGWWVGYLSVWKREVLVES